MQESENMLLEVRNLKKSFPVRKGLLSRVVDQVRAVDGVSFDIGHGEDVGPGRRKRVWQNDDWACDPASYRAYRRRHHLPQQRQARAGETHLEIDVAAASPEQLRALRCEMQIIFQDPFSSLNPRMNNGDIVAEPLKVQGVSNVSARRDQVAGLLESVGLSGTR